MGFLQVKHPLYKAELLVSDIKRWSMVSAQLSVT